MTPLERRHAATQATVARFEGRAFRWGSVDCARLAAFQLRGIGIKVSLAKAGSYRSALAAKAALRRLGHETLADVLDGLGLPRIAPARAMMGDIVEFEADHPIGALGVVVGNGNMIAFHESHDVPVIMTMGQIKTAWAVI